MVVELCTLSFRTDDLGKADIVATALFGGMTPLVATWLIAETGNKAAPGLWLALGGACGLLATVVVYRRRASDLPATGIPAPVTPTRP